MPGTKRWARTEQAGSGAVPGEIGGEREAGADRCPKVEILRTQEATDAEAERGLAAWSQEPWGADELQWRRVGQGRSGCCSPRPHPHLPPASHLQKDGNHSAWLAGRSVQASPFSILANQLHREGSRGGQKHWWDRGSEETALPWSRGLQRHAAPLGTIRDPSKDDVGEVWSRVSGFASGA